MVKQQEVMYGISYRFFAAEDGHCIRGGERAYPVASELEARAEFDKELREMPEYRRGGVPHIEAFQVVNYEMRCERLQRELAGQVVTEQDFKDAANHVANAHQEMLEKLAAAEAERDMVRAEGKRWQEKSIKQAVKIGQYEEANAKLRAERDKLRGALSEQRRWIEFVRLIQNYPHMATLDHVHEVFGDVMGEDTK